MPTSFLKNILYTQLDSKTWCATAQLIPRLPPQPLTSLHLVFDNPLKPYLMQNNVLYRDDWRLIPNTTVTKQQIAKTRRQQQRKGVRLLLQNLLIEIGITDLLDESQFPYRLIKSGYYVCFSHSGSANIKSSQLELDDKVAVTIGTHRPIGIDIEIQAINWHVAQRFYHPAEIEILAKLPIDQRNLITKWLWQLKESFIKIYQYTLAQGLGKSYADIIPKLLVSLNNDDSAVITIKDTQYGYQIVALPYQYTLIVF
ncbi:4'-phosphopantetheinyl transferase family protein [Psychrobacter urativorans]|uniref:4'-phosphopantetheinyl transferase domain-containing protein n=1 Tax=Psychrobacter urativorans TaxID=45610 RepID=A0A0M4U6B4_9GAMM|nr:4'-phosphopantetheinyl transferase superfamily protein [Psychrobacter urativorans]ALF60656.1 hypothetical protein AOC03_11895 [Psychrobacter urativorans]